MFCINRNTVKSKMVKNWKLGNSTYKEIQYRIKKRGSFMRNKTKFVSNLRRGTMRD